MKETILGNQLRKVPSIAVGCMRLSEKSKEEMNVFYHRFFEKSKEILAKNGLIIMYTNEAGFVRKELRLQKEYKLLQDFVISEKDEFHLYVIELKR